MASPAVDPNAPAPPMQGLVPAPSPQPSAGGVLGALSGLVRGAVSLPGDYINALGSQWRNSAAQHQFQQQQNALILQQEAMKLHAAGLQMQGLTEVRNGIKDPDQQAMFDADPIGYVNAHQEVWKSAHTPTSIKAGDSLGSAADGIAVTAPSMGVTKDGVGYTQTPSATTNTGALPTIQSVAPGTTVTPMAPIGAGAPQANGAPTAPAPGAQDAAGAGLTGAHIDPLGFFKSFVLKHEGGLNPADMNGSPTNYGINQAAHPGVDVRKLTPDGAAQIFQNDYWNKSGAANLPAPLAAVHADTYFINPTRATQFLQQSGGDWQKYMGLRQAWMAHMVANDPAATKYDKAWTKRNADLTKVASGLSAMPGQQPASDIGTNPSAPVPPNASMPTAITGNPITYQNSDAINETPVSAANPLPTTTGAGSAIIGKVGIDQTTPGTTNGVQVNAALPAGSNIIGGVSPTGNNIPFTPTIQNAAYASGNCMGGFQTVALGSAATVLNQISIASQGGLATAKQVYVFAANPSGSTCTDKSTFTIATADLSKLIWTGSITPTAPTGTTKTWGAAPSLGLSIPTGGTVYVAIVDTTTETPGSTSDLVLNIGVL